MPLRVPVLSGPRVEARSPYSNAGPRATPVDNSASQAVKGLGDVFGSIAALTGGMQKASVAHDKQQMEAKKQANSLVVANASMELQLQLQEQVAEAKKQKGVAASETRAEYLKRIKETREQVAEGISDPDARDQFLAGSINSVVASSAAVENHVGAEFEAARGATVKARQDNAISQAESGADDAVVQALEEDVAKDIEANQLSPEDGKGKVAEFKSKMVMSRVKALVAKGAWIEAKELIAAREKDLGTRTDEAKALAERARVGWEKDNARGLAAKVVRDGVEAARNEDGIVEEDKLREAVNLDGLPPELEPMRGEVEKMLNDQVRVGESMKKERVMDARNAVNLADLHGKPIPGAAEAFLEKYDPDFLLARKHQREREARWWASYMKSKGPSRAQMDREQQALDEAYRYRVQRELTLNPAANVDDVLTQFIQDYGGDAHVSKKELERAGAEAAKAQKGVDTKEAKQEHSAAQRFERTFEGMARSKLKKGQKVDEALLNERVGKAITIYRERTLAKGAPLDEKEITAIEAELAADEKTTVPGRFWGTKTVVKPKVDTLDVKPTTDIKKPEQQSQRKQIGGVWYVKTGSGWVRE